MHNGRDRMDEYRNNGSGVTACRLRLYTAADQPVIAVVTELPTNTGTSVTNAIERIANNLCAMLQIAPEALVLIQHEYPRQWDGGWNTDPEEFSRVQFQVRRGQLCLPRWRSITRAELETLLAQPFAD